MPERIDRYRVIATLGSGAQGIVYEAHDPELDRRVAIKLMRSRAGRRHATHRLLREATALAQLSHPNVVGVHHVGEWNGGVYVVAQLVDGITLSQWLDTPRSWPEILRVFAAAGRGLAAAHERAIVHRDFKPANVLVGHDGVVRLVDFGLARDAADDESGSAASSTGAWDSHARSLTVDGFVMGTPHYMAPEQHEGASATAAADQYAFCVALFEALWRQRPFRGRDLATLVQEKRACVLTFPRHDAAPRQLRSIVATGLQPRPEQRWPSMPALVAELERVVAPRRRIRRWAVVGAVLVGAIGIAAQADREDGVDCGANEAWAQVWSPSRASALAGAFASTRRSYADDAADRVRATVDAYGANWIAEREAACAALDVAPDGDARLACLDARLDELAAAVTVLEEDAPGAVERAVEIVASVPTPHRCASPEADAAPPALAPAVARLRRSIARADALQRAGRYDDAAVEIERAEQAAIALDHAPVIAEAALARSTILQGMGEYAEARAREEYAYFVAQENGHDALAFRAAWGLAMSARLVGGGDADADAWARRAESTHARLGDAAEPMQAGVLAYMFAAIALQRADYGEAYARAHEATAILEHELGATDHRVTATMIAETHALSGLERLDDAEEQARRTIASAEASLGPQHPFTADAWILLAIVMQQRGAFADALAIHHRVLAIQEAALDPESPALATTWLNIGNVEAELGDGEASEQALRRALSIARTSLGPENPACVGILHNLALTLEARGKRDEAIAAWHEALELGQRHFAPEHPQMLEMIASLDQARGS